MQEMGYSVTVVAFNLHNWTTEKEEQLQQELHGVEFHHLETSRHPVLPWLMGSLLERAARFLLPLAPSDPSLAAIALDKRSRKLLRWVKSGKSQYDAVIAHNPPAFYPAAWLGRATGKPYAIDVEDYHPGEKGSPVMQRCVTILMRSLLRKAAYVSYAAPLIKEYSDRLSGSSEKDNGIVINNSFSRKEFVRPAADPNEDRLRLVWFSQYVDYHRGLEKILPVLDEFRDHIRLTLIGSARAHFVARELTPRDYIHPIDSLSQQDLHRELSRHDLGLALEDGTADLNRDLCLTNKIWSYLLAGLYILASDTSAQRRFMEEHPDHGVCAPLSPDSLRPVMSRIVADREILRAGATARFARAGAAAWDNESALLARKWNSILLPNQPIS
jgi:glycosyltransferase involved in cell wall biosynthesis